MHNRNLAYDLSLFEEKSKKNNIVRLNTKKIRRLRVLKAKLALFLSVGVVGVAGFLGISTFMIGQAKLAELTAQQCRLSEKLQESESRYVQLSMRKESAVNDENLVSKLKDDFGMTEGKAMEYIRIDNKCQESGSLEVSGFEQLTGKVCNFLNNLFSV